MLVVKIICVYVNVVSANVFWGVVYAQLSL